MTNLMLPYGNFLLTFLSVLCLCRLRDWGETNYNIVRNWTPHTKKLTPLSSSQNKSKASTKELSPVSKLPSSSSVKFPVELSTSYRLRRSSRKQQSAASSDSSWYIPDSPTANTGSISFRSLKHNSHDRSGPLDDEIGKNEHVHSDAHSSSMSSSESPNGAHLSLNHMSDNCDRQPLNPNSTIHVASLEDGSCACCSGGGDVCEGEEQGAPVQRSGNEDISGGDMVNEEEASDADPMDCGDNNMDTDTLLPPPTRKSAGYYYLTYMCAYHVYLKYYHGVLC